MRKKSFEKIWKNATDSEWEIIEKDRTTLDGKDFYEKYGTKPESVRIYCMMHFHEKERYSAIYESELAKLRKENKELKERLNSSKKKDLLHLVSGTAYKTQIYTTEGAFKAFSDMADKVSTQTGLKKYSATALMMEEAVKMFGKLFG